jgi:hypothetical protein
VTTGDFGPKRHGLKLRPRSGVALRSSARPGDRSPRAPSPSLASASSP